MAAGDLDFYYLYIYGIFFKSFLFPRPEIAINLLPVKIN